MGQQTGVAPNPEKFQKLYSDIQQELRQWQEQTNDKNEQRMFGDALSALQSVERVIQKISNQ